MAMDSSTSLSGEVRSGTKLQSAVAAFSNIVSITSTHDSTSIAQKVSPESWTTGPHSLPTEIIRMIFHFVFESCVSSKYSASSDDLVVWLDEDPLSPSLFPYALACVSLRWFHILGTMPNYWTRVVITVDAIAASLDAARTTLGWAGNRPLKVVVTRHHGTSDTRNSERIGISRAMQLLRSHINHTWSLSFDIEHNSSIPALWREGGCAWRLKVLGLLCRNDAPSSKWLPAGNSHEYEGTLKVPLLEQVMLSGHFFKDPLMTHPRLAGWFQHVTSLTIRGNAALGETATPLFRFLSVIDLFSSLHTLTIEDVSFDSNPHSYPYPLVLRPPVLHLRRVTGNMALQGILMPALAGNSPRTDVTIIDCTFRGFLEADLGPGFDLGFFSTNLTIASMPPYSLIENFISRWNGVNLSVQGCSRVSRKFLRRLHGDAAPASLSRLRIVDCEDLDFSAGDVIALVRSRKLQAALVSLMGGGNGEDGDDDGFVALAEVCVEGRGPSISAERARWLAEHVERFSWDTVDRDGVRYVWDGSVGRVTTSSASVGVGV